MPNLHVALVQVTAIALTVAIAASEAAKMCSWSGRARRVRGASGAGVEGASTATKTGDVVARSGGTHRVPRDFTVAEG